MANILASKLYISSKRQDKILAAIKNPMNQELVMQMKDYLDEEFISPEYLQEESDNADAFSDVQEDSSSSSGRDSGTSNYSRGFSGFSGSGTGENYLDDDSLDDFEDDDNLEESSSEEFEDSDTGENYLDEDSTDENVVEESTNINSSSEIALSLEEIKGTLNSREDCQGVIRVVEKDNELWIYYNDDTNLNNVMTSVIEGLLSSGYSCLEFNRLARSNNAVVFDILRHSVDSYGDDSKK